MLDHWAIGQVFPVMPLAPADERPDAARGARRSHLRFGRQGRAATSRALEDRGAPAAARAEPGEPYYLGIFLVGAYQDILGDAHNLFGRLPEVHVYADDEEAGNFWIEKIDSRACRVHDMLAQVQYFPNDLNRRMSELVRRKIDTDEVRPERRHAHSQRVQPSASTIRRTARRHGAASNGDEGDAR